MLRGVSPWLSSYLLAVAQVAGVAEARHDVLVLVESRVDGSAPYRGAVVGECLSDVLYSLRCGYHARHVHALWCALGEECLVAQLHRASGGEHRVGYDERLAFDVGRGEILNVYAYVGVRLVGVLAVCAHEGVAGMVEYVQKTVVERQTGPEYGCEHHLVGWHTDARRAERRLHLAYLVAESLAQLVGLELAYAHDVVAEKQSVVLVVLVAHLGHILVHDGVCLAEVDNLHDVLCFIYNLMCGNGGAAAESYRL